MHYGFMFGVLVELEVKTEDKRILGLISYIDSKSLLIFGSVHFSDYFHLPCQIMS